MARGPFPLRISFSVSPEKVERIFRGLGEDLRDFTPAMERIRTVLARMFQTVFASQGAALGGMTDVGRGMTNTAGGWPPLNEAYAHRKSKDGASPELLKRSGRLQASLTNAEGGADSIRAVRAGQTGIPMLIYGTRLPYAAATNFGAKGRGASSLRVPSRPFVGITEEARQQAVEILGQHLQERLDKAGAALSARGVA